jgi:GNAT superfamily N-acetyltransferase/DNA-binding MarR family transcriptional regulator
VLTHATLKAGSSRGDLAVNAVEELRRFNRFYTHQIGLLNERLSNSRFSLPQARVLFELAAGKAQTAAGLSRILDMDKAHLSRILARFRAQRLVLSRISPDHAKHRLLTLSKSGVDAFESLQNATVTEMRKLLAPLDAGSTRRLLDAMQAIQATLTVPAPAAPAPGSDAFSLPTPAAPAPGSDAFSLPTPAAPAPGSDAFSLRSPKVGDLGWVIHRQAVLYAQEYGWDWTYESLISGILAEFVAKFDAAREHAWIAERDGAIAGSIFLMRGDDPLTAKLRLLYVEPAARGRGIGAGLVAACISRARATGYRKLTLWTNDVLVSARRLYEAAGFRLTAEEKHRSFGHDLVGQTWLLEL